MTRRKTILYIIVLIVALCTPACKYNQFESAPPATEEENDEQEDSQDDSDEETDTDIGQQTTALYDIIAALGSDETLTITTPTLIKAIVQSSDQHQNFTSQIIVADTQNPAPTALQLNIAIENSHQILPPGDTILLQLQNFSITSTTNGIPLASYLKSPIYSTAVLGQTLQNLGSTTGLVPTPIDLEDVTEEHLGQMLLIQGVQFTSPGSKFHGIRSFYTPGLLSKSAFLLTQTTATFASQTIPEGLQNLQVIPILYSGILVFSLNSPDALTQTFLNKN